MALPPPTVKPSRPLPKRKTKGTRTAPEDTDALFISSRTGYRDLSSPRRPTNIPCPPAKDSIPNSRNPTPPPRQGPSHRQDVSPLQDVSAHQDLSTQDHTTYVTGRGFTVQVMRSSQRLPRRELTPGPDDRSMLQDPHGDANANGAGEKGDEDHESHYSDDGDIPSGSDFEEAEAERMRRHRYKTGLCRPTTPTMEEQDEEDDDEFERVPRTPPSTPPRIPASKKGKGRAPNPNRLSPEARRQEEPDENTRLGSDDELANSDCNEEEDTSVQYSSGPIPEFSKKKAYAAHKHFMKELQEIARECNKPVKHFRAMVGMDAKSTRRISAWDAYQKWYPVAVEAKPKDGMWHHLSCGRATTDSYPL